VKYPGQGGWDETRKLDPNDIEGQVDLAFKNVDKVLQAVGLRGWEDVYSIRSYHVDIGTSFNIVVEKLRQRLPGHRPIWTSIGVTRLAFQEMLIEIEVEAYAGKALTQKKATVV
jgi:enamine deaminase RidA (YjgF/YER057c/UK114 family)